MSEFDVEFIDRGDREAQFLVRDITPALANGIRRAILADVPTLTVDSVRMMENSSVMFDEQIGLRLGLVPLTTPDDYEPGDTVSLALDVEGPGTAYSGDLVSEDPQVQPADENVPIIDLKEGQRIEFEAVAELGRGRDHAKNQGAVAVGYRHLQRIEVGDDRGEYAGEEPEIVRGVVETEDGELVPAEEFDNDLVQRYPDREVAVEDVENAFVFHVESDGSLPVDELVLRGVDVLHGTADELEQQVQL